MTAAVAMQLGSPDCIYSANLLRTLLCIFFFFLMLIVLSKVQKAKYSSCKHSKKKNAWQAHCFAAAQSTPIICPTLSLLCPFMTIFSTCRFPLPVFLYPLHASLQSAVISVLHHCAHYGEGWQSGPFTLPVPQPWSLPYRLRTMWAQKALCPFSTLHSFPQLSSRKLVYSVKYLGFAKKFSFFLFRLWAQTRVSVLRINQKKANKNAFHF